MPGLTGDSTAPAVGKCYRWIGGPPPGEYVPCRARLAVARPRFRRDGYGSGARSFPVPAPLCLAGGLTQAERLFSDGHHMGGDVRLVAVAILAQEHSVAAIDIGQDSSEFPDELSGPDVGP